MNFSDINALLPLLNIVFVIGIVPLVKSLNSLNNNLDKIILRIDFIEQTTITNQNRLDKDIDLLSSKLQKHLDSHINNH